jgi:hypothetical protein
MSSTSSHRSNPLPPRREGAGVSSIQWRRDVPEAIRSLGALADANYADIVTATIDRQPDGTPEQWIQAALSGLPRGLLMFIPFVQRAFLGLRLTLRPSPDHLLGCKIAHRDQHWLRIEASSWFLTGHVVMHIEGERISFASFIRYDRPLAALVWPPISLIHRQVALTLMRSGLSTLQANDYALDSHA